MTEYPNLQPDILKIAAELQNLIVHIFTQAEISSDSENICFGFGSGYKDLVLSFPSTRKSNPGIVNRSSLNDPHNPFEREKPKIHQRVKQHIDSCYLQSCKFCFCGFCSRSDTASISWSISLNGSNLFADI